MAGILEKLAGNKMIAGLAFKQLTNYIKKENISFIVIYVNNDGEIDAKEYKEPMAIIPAATYNELVQNQKPIE